MKTGPPVTRPCGTPAAYRRHLRHREPPCDACIMAARRAAADRDGGEANTLSLDRRPVRNGVPEFIPYIYPGSRFMARMAADPGFLASITGSPS